MAKRKKTDNEVDLDDFFFGEIKPKKEDLEIKPKVNAEETHKYTTIVSTEKQKNTFIKKELNITPYLVKNDIILKHIHIGSQTKKKLIKSAEILGINQYDLATNVLEVFFKKYGGTIKNMEEDIL